MLKKLSFVLGAMVITSSFANIHNEFKASNYNIEFEKMLDTCMNMQADGKLPGLSAGINSNAVFQGDKVKLSKINSLRYPLQMKCVVDKKDEILKFTFKKETQNGIWRLVQK